MKKMSHLGCGLILDTALNTRSVIAYHYMIDALKKWGQSHSSRVNNAILDEVQ